jgi:hypothetical protein
MNNKIGATAVLWTLLLAIPFTALALAGTAYVTDHLIEIATAISTWSVTVLHIQRDWLFEAELLGMIAGQVIILAILGFTILAMRAEKQSK